MSPRLLLALASLAAAPALATTDAHQHGHGHVAQAAAVADAPMAEGTVRKIDKPGGKMTIAHGPLERLGMPPMTMVFRVKDAAMLDEVKAGDKIRFHADRVNGSFVVTELEATE